MKDLETGKDKIKKICDILKKETLEPAHEEAQQIIEAAQEKAQEIIADAEKSGSQKLSETQKSIEEKLRLFESSLKLAWNQGVEALKQELENKLFNKEFTEWVEKQTASAEVGAQLVKAIVEAIERDGVSAEFSVMVPKQIPAESINALLSKKILDKIREKSVSIGEFIGGIQVKLHDKNLVLDLSDEAIKELLYRYLRRDFREKLFHLGG